MKNTKNKIKNINEDGIRDRKKNAEKKGFAPPKYLLFGEYFMKKGFKVTLYEPQKGVSKYVRLHKDGKVFTVRFSNHKPNAKREARGDCDFFVGVTNFNVTTTRDAAKAAIEFFKNSGV